MKKVLHVGCGQKTIESMGSGFHDGSWQEVRFDVDERVRPDVVGSIVKMEAVPDGSMDAIWSSHNLEHVFHHEAPHVLREFRRVLKDSGFCVITCPDIENVCARVAAGSLTAELYRTPAGPMTALDVLYGHLASVARGEVHMAHKTGFGLRLLAARLQQAGFPRTSAGAGGGSSISGSSPSTTGSPGPRPGRASSATRTSRPMDPTSRRRPANRRGRASSPWWNPAGRRDGRGARLTRREEGAYWAYATDEQRRQAGCIAARMQRGFHHGLLGYHSPTRWTEAEV